MPRRSVPDSRIRVLNTGEPAPVRKGGSYVLYWMNATRRTRWNYALDRSVELANELGKPLVVLEALRVGYRWASDRLHRFVLQGMAVNRRAFEGTPVRYYAYVEPNPDDGKGLLRELADSACAVVTDDYPCFFLPRMVASARLDVSVQFEAIDSDGLLPLRATDRAFARAFDFRRFLQRELKPHLEQPPRKNALARTELPRLTRLPNGVSKRWPEAGDAMLAAEPEALAALPIDHSVAPAPVDGGADAGERALRRFLESGLGGYADDRNRVDAAATSGLSSYLHFGHVSPHHVFARLLEREGASVEQVGGPTAKGKREGWWGLSPAVEAFLDQLITWRELGRNACVRDPAYDRFESVPAWARETLAKHEGDERAHLYDLGRFEQAATHDELWNAAQSQLVHEGIIHNYLRMLWGKKILHWSASAPEAFDIMVELNNKYALDGRDPNSYSGILWTLGKFDRPWGPEREVFGTVRYMTSESTRRKMKVGPYLERWGQPTLF